MRRNFRRVAAPGPARAQTRDETFVPPVRGWIRNENLAASQPAGAYVLDNWFPTTTDVRLRGGSRLYATVSTGAVTSLFTYKTGSVEKFFAADQSNIFDISIVADPDVIPTPAISGQTAGEYSTVPINSVGGDFLYAVNGADEALLYDGSTWTAINGVSTPAITGVATSDLSFVWVFANRLLFIEKDTMNAWYLPVDSIGGAASTFSLAGIFKRGGALLFGGTWSLDSGDGLDDKCVFVSTTGEVAIYEGTNPGSTSDWRKVGVYEITPPLGMNATLKAGGDLVIATEDGLVPLTQAIQKDSAALSLSAITRNIEPEWKAQVNARQSIAWEVLKWPANNMAVVSLPVINETTEAYCFVVNLETGAWARYTGWDTRSLGLFRNIGHFGTSDGKVLQMEVGGNDNGMPYTATCVWSFSHLKSPGRQKIINSARTVFTADRHVNPQITVSTDYAVSLPPAPNSIAEYISDTWDSGLWDQATWDAGIAFDTQTRWSSIGKNGFAIAPQVQLTSGVTPTPHMRLIALHLLYEVGGIMV